MQNLIEINRRFEQSWEQISSSAEQYYGNKTERSLKKLKRCLRWCTAYSMLQAQCLPLLRPFHEQPLAIIKWFWVEYGENNWISDIPPTPREFMEWYCDSLTIREEISNPML